MALKFFTEDQIMHRPLSFESTWKNEEPFAGPISAEANKAFSDRVNEHVRGFCFHLIPF
jgi:hypothetical protein